ncbi:DNA-binding transcriptional regulator, PucR family [Streptoalloteichus tenebrarius]|uniref:DNA-binding transcriptional regulator, PucR family n=2 Tax=Streptoalloteichus tenebrarius (strain ATCC 17920 / DSM 40477 / JCM 4838 / CBS 697.72 / NBRC 16177 / NCIMB 11028 / NRRL B-12390 / A12253. 1 / ISP 5477) TaxID=1933 RepID=A0ABT1HMF8_STRSD|nr:DNA-binding transcriptional regulator, PucR family [Streptoalloteichus tenebrarius]
MLAVMSSAAAHERSSDHPDLSSDTLRKLERASGGMAAASITAMERQLPWFRRLSADQRSGVLLVTQNGVAGFVAWLRDPQQAIRLTAEAFRGAPRDLARWVSLRQTVELVRIAIEVFEQQLPTLAADDAERAVLTEAVLRYGREIAFAAATSYAAAAEARGAWDARLEALVVDGIVRGDAEESLLSRAAALGWDPAAEATVLVGNPTSEDPPEVVYEVRSRAARAGRPVLIGVQGSRLVVVLAGPVDGPAGHEVLTRMATAFGSGPVVAGPTMSSLAEAHRSAQDALSGLRAVVAWPAAPRPVRSTDLLPERALAGDPEAERQLVDGVVRPLVDAGGSLLETVDAYLEVGGVLESCARQLFVHPNTVRYRLRRVTELTGRNASDPRDALVLRVALAVGRLARSRGLW